MADNTTLPSGAGGDIIRTFDRTTAKTQLVALDFGGDTGAGGEQVVTSLTPLPVFQTPPTTDAPQFTSTVGSPLTDWSGLPIKELMLDPGSGVALQTQVQTLPTQPLFVSFAPSLLSSAIAPATPAINMLKAAPGQIVTIAAFNVLATPVYLKLFDATYIALGTTGATYQFMIPGNTGGAGFVLPFGPPIPFNNAIAYAVTNAISATDNTSITASSVIVNIGYR